MEPECGGIHPQCAHAFSEIAQTLGRLEDMDGKLDKLSEAVLGNGDVQQSIAFRLAVIERRQERTCQTKSKWGDRVWKLAAALALLAAGWLLRAL